MRALSWLTFVFNPTTSISASQSFSRLNCNIFNFVFFFFVYFRRIFQVQRRCPTFQFFYARWMRLLPCFGTSMKVLRSYILLYCVYFFRRSTKKSVSEKKEKEGRKMERSLWEILKMARIAAKTRWEKRLLHVHKMW